MKMVTHAAIYDQLAARLEQRPKPGFMAHDGAILLTNDFFFKDGDDNPVAVLLRNDPGRFVFFDRNAERRREERLARLVP